MAYIIVPKTASKPPVGMPINPGHWAGEALISGISVPTNGRFWDEAQRVALPPKGSGTGDLAWTVLPNGPWVGEQCIDCYPNNVQAVTRVIPQFTTPFATGTPVCYSYRHIFVPKDTTTLGYIGDCDRPATTLYINNPSGGGAGSISMTVRDASDAAHLPFFHFTAGQCLMVIVAVKNGLVNMYANVDNSGNPVNGMRVAATYSGSGATAASVSNMRGPTPTQITPYSGWVIETTQPTLWPQALHAGFDVFENLWIDLNMANLLYGDPWSMYGSRNPVFYSYPISAPANVNSMKLGVIRGSGYSVAY